MVEESFSDPDSLDTPIMATLCVDVDDDNEDLDRLFEDQLLSKERKREVCINS